MVPRNKPGTRALPRVRTVTVSGPAPLHSILLLRSRTVCSATIAQTVRRTGRPKSVLQDGALSANAHLNGERLGRCGLLEHWILLCAAKGVAGCPPNGPVCHARGSKKNEPELEVPWLTIHS